MAGKACGKIRKPRERKKRGEREREREIVYVRSGEK